MNNQSSYPIIAVSGCFDETAERKEYTTVRKVSTNPDVFKELKKYNPAKIIRWGITGLAGLTAIVAGTILTVKHFSKR